MIDFFLMKDYRVWSIKIIDVITASFMSALGYFSPVKNIIHLTLLFFMLDVLWGWLADRKLNNARFKPSKVWKVTMPRIALSLVLLMGSFMIDKETGQTLVDTPSIISWMICSLLLLSILRNGYIVTNWDAIPYLSKIVRARIKEKSDTLSTNDKNLEQWENEKDY